MFVDICIYFSMKCFFGIFLYFLKWFVTFLNFSKNSYVYSHIHIQVYVNKEISPLSYRLLSFPSF